MGTNQLGLQFNPILGANTFSVNVTAGGTASFVQGLQLNTSMNSSANNPTATGLVIVGGGAPSGPITNSTIAGILVSNLSWASPVGGDSAAIEINDQAGNATSGHNAALRIDDQTDSGAWAIKTGLGKVEFGDSLEVHGDLGFFATTPIAKQTVTGSRGANAALASLLTALAAYGLITDSST